jgi:hypothetical protein
MQFLTMAMLVFVIAGVVGGFLLFATQKPRYMALTMALMVAC